MGYSLYLLHWISMLYAEVFYFLVGYYAFRDKSREIYHGLTILKKRYIEYGQDQNLLDRNGIGTSDASNSITQDSAKHIRRLYEGSDIRVYEDCGRKGDKWEMEEHNCKRR